MMIDIRNLEEFDNHQSFYRICDNSIGLKAFIAIHCGDEKKVAFGATRLWGYSSEVEAIQDVLRLSKTMSVKSKCAGLSYGGAKGVIIKTKLLQTHRSQAFAKYAKFVESLGGQFITGTDVGLNRSDLDIMVKNSRYIVGIKVNPEYYTALGLRYAIDATLEFIYRDHGVSNRTFSIVGLGKVGQSILELLYPSAKEIYVSDIDKYKTEMVKKIFPKVVVLSQQQIVTQPVDILIPCAVGATITNMNVGLLKCKAVVGGANNPLEDNTVAVKMFNNGIIYAPDVIVNAGGLISVVYEYENSGAGRIEHNDIYKQVSNIKYLLSSIFIESVLNNISTIDVMEKMVKKVEEL